jgi:hypothetical protein
MGRGWEWAGDIGENGMQILVAARHDLCSPMPFNSAKNAKSAMRFLPKVPKLPMALLALLAVAPPLARVKPVRKALNNMIKFIWKNPFQKLGIPIDAFGSDRGNVFLLLKTFESSVVYTELVDLRPNTVLHKKIARIRTST